MEATHTHMVGIVGLGLELRRDQVAVRWASEDMLGKSLGGSTSIAKITL